MHGKSTRKVEIIPSIDFEQKPGHTKQHIYDLEEKKGIKPKKITMR